ncbi:hypothetical protein JOM56_009795 [Amanita muscaria]
MNIASKIPTDILEEIFLHTINGPISNIQDSSSPWAIERVCKSWRSAFVNYPKLWTWITINIVESYSRGQDLNSVNRGLSLCLKRSRNNPLNISLHLPTEEYDKTSPYFAPVWKTFLSCSHRWRIVYLENVLLFTLGSCKGATPILESLTIHNPKDNGYYSVCDGFQIAPRLTRFTVLHVVTICAVPRWNTAVFTASARPTNGSDSPFCSHDDPNEVSAKEILNSFIQRSSCKIHKLTLSSFGRYSKFTPLVQLFPDVVELCLVGAKACLEDLLSPSQFPGLRVLDHATYSSSTTCSAVPLAKVIFRPVFEDGKASFLVTTTGWASFESYVQVGSCCELNLTRQLWLPEEALRSPLPATNGSPNTNITPSPSSSTLGAPLHPGLTNSLDDFDSNIFWIDGDINFERDFGQWFNGGDVPLDLK